MRSLIETAAAGSAINPVLTLWNGIGDFLFLGSGTERSAITFTANANETYYAVIGSAGARLTSGMDLVGDVGDYALAFE